MNKIFSRIQDLLKILRHKMRMLVDACPVVYLSICKLNPKSRGMVINDKTELVIQGFPRSGNTFATAAFIISQGPEIKIARHLHAPAQVIVGVKKKIPTLVLLRSPRDAVLSLIIREPHISLKQALKDYIHFYKSIIAYKHGYVIATFDEITQDFDIVIKKINSRFGTRFRSFLHTEDNVKECFNLIEQMDVEDTGLKNVQERTVARPSSEREQIKAELERKFENPKYRRMLDEAEKIYRQFIEFK